MGTKVKVKKIINQVGKRKTAIARVTVKEGKGIVRINKKPLELLEPEVVRTKISEPLFIASEHPDVAGDVGSIELDVEVKGGGFMGQAEAARTAIARGLVDWTGNEGLKDKSTIVLINLEEIEDVDTARKHPTAIMSPQSLFVTLLVFMSE